MNFGRITARAGAVLLMSAVFAFSALAQSAAPAIQQTQAPVVISPEVSADRRITFRLRALAGENVKLIGSDIPGVGAGQSMELDAMGIWRLTIGPVPPGSYRYNFNVNGVSVIDPRNPLVSELNSSRNTVELLKKHGFTPISRETEGGHTWINWRNYLNEFAPQLFQTKTAM